MNIRVIAIIAILSSGCNKEQVYDCNELVKFDFYEHGYIARIKSTQLPVTGKEICYASEGSRSYKLYECQYLNGFLHGEWKNYNANGQITYFETFRYGQLHGESAGYYENGNLRWRRFYKFDREDSIWTAYHKNGKLKSEGAYKFEAADLQFRKKTQRDTTWYLNPASLEEVQEITS